MQKKNDPKVFLGLGLITLLIIAGIFGYKKFGGNVSVPQISDDGSIGQNNIEALPTGSELLNKKEPEKMDQPVQVIKKENGLVIEIVKEGTGQPVRSGNTVSVDYRGFFTDGKIFDESYKRGQQFSFTVGGGQVIAGWDEGVLGMKVGEKRRLTVPSSLGYGPNDYGPIPGGSTLIFDIELHKISQ